MLSNIYAIPKISILLFISFSMVSESYHLKLLSIVLIIFFFFKSYMNDRSCFFSFLECKLRNIPKEKGFLFNSLNSIYDENHTNHKYLLYFILNFIMFFNSYNLYYDEDFHFMLVSSF